MRQYESYAFTGENRLNPRAYYIPYENMEKALSGKKMSQPITPHYPENGISTIILPRKRPALMPRLGVK